MFEFDGSSTAVVVPDGLVSHSPGDNFTIASWMKHAAHPELDRHTKEHIICNADDHSEYFFLYLLFKSSYNMLEILLFTILLQVYHNKLVKIHVK